MKIESVIFIYGAVCLSMMAFNIVYALRLKQRDPMLQKHYERLQKRISAELERIRSGEPVDAAHIKYLKKKLRKESWLLSFEQIVLDYSKADAEGIRSYLQQIQPSLLYLAALYAKGEDILSAYFARFVANCVAGEPFPTDALQNILLGYVSKKSLYCRVNSLHAFMKFGNVDHILTALHLQDNEDVYLHPKILTESFLAFNGSHAQLIEVLLKNWDTFSVRTQLGICNYIRFRSNGYQTFMRKLMNDETADKELRLSAIRYFGRYPDERMVNDLLAYASNSSPSMWEYATVSLSSLACYNGSQVLDVLKAALHSPNWYIRHAAAVSLKAHDIEYSDLSSIMMGTDRYAKEMIMYQFEAQELLESEAMSQ